MRLRFDEMAPLARIMADIVQADRGLDGPPLSGDSLSSAIPQASERMRILGHVCEQVQATVPCELPDDLTIDGLARSLRAQLRPNRFGLTTEQVYAGLETCYQVLEWPQGWSNFKWPAPLSNLHGKAAHLTNMGMTMEFFMGSLNTVFGLNLKYRRGEPWTALPTIGELVRYVWANQSESGLVPALDSAEPGMTMMGRVIVKIRRRPVALSESMLLRRALGLLPRARKWGELRVISDILYLVDIGPMPPFGAWCLGTSDPATIGDLINLIDALRGVSGTPYLSP